jgi:hypothetical protein
MVAVYCVLLAILAAGLNVTVLPLTLTVPVTAVPVDVAASRTLAVVRVELLIGSENVAETEEFVAIPVAAFDGDVATTVGGVVSGAAAVVKFHV